MLRPDISTDEIIALYQSGKTSYQVAEAMHISQPTVIYRLRSAGVPRRTRWEHFASVPLAEALRRYANGESAPKIAAEIGVTPAAIYVGLRRYGMTARPKTKPPCASGPASPSWKSGRHVSYGYTYLWLAPNLRVQEHRFVMEQHLGRMLKPGEIVHHLNGIRSDNRIDNLCVTTRKHHEHDTYVKCLQARVRKLEALIQKNS